MGRETGARLQDQVEKNVCLAVGERVVHCVDDIECTLKSAGELSLDSSQIHPHRERIIRE